MINPLPEYYEDTDKIVYDVDIIDYIPKGQAKFFKQLKEKIGMLVISFNTLESEIEDRLLESLNERAEDPRMWLLIRDFTFDKKVSSLKEIYIQIFQPENEKSAKNVIAKIDAVFKKIYDVKNFRNLISHCNWGNHTDLKYFVTGVKLVKKHNSILRIRKEIKLADFDTTIDTIIGLMAELEDLHSDITGL